MTDSPLRPAPRPAPLHDDDPRLGHPDHDLALRHVLPVVGRRRQGTDTVVLLLGTALVGVLGLATFWSMSHSRAERPAAAASSAPVQPVRGYAPAPMPAIPPAAITPLGNVQPLPQPALDTGRGGMANTGNPLATPALVYNAGPPATAAPVTEPAPAPKPAPGAPPANGGDDFAARLGATGSGGATAAVALNPRTTIAQGTLIPAVLETAIDTDVPGYARAIVSADVRSFDGSHVLVPRSSRLVGQYKSGLQAGQRRVYVIWTRLIRPDGVAVALGSPGTGFNGESGLGGKVDSHFFERFGSAMLLTVMSGLSAIGSSGTSVVIAGGGQSAAAAAVGQTGQIGPTIRVHPGEPIRVFTARDLDFAGVEAH
ncbi:TrbI/VirB10 family protein [Novosphingobium acidiphilum]|uniref:TrbI/VirB10 family protein n=1 Tax=Novosphingobium acidiphilum TaxID=505248 RepID=UPI0004270927|nr:TrbI/VirB10 family protein [Novosphingobium acidiphilum]